MTVKEIVAACILGMAVISLLLALAVGFKRPELGVVFGIAAYGLSSIAQGVVSP